MEKPPGDRAWRLVGTAAEPVLCHKPCTVSGGGKSEISKPITDAILHRAGVRRRCEVASMNKVVNRLINRDYSRSLPRQDRAQRHGPAHRYSAPERSLGSVIKLLSPDERDYTAGIQCLAGERVPQYIKELVFVVKRYLQTRVGREDWRSNTSRVDIINGVPGNELKLRQPQTRQRRTCASAFDDGRRVA